MTNHNALTGFGSPTMPLKLMNYYIIKMDITQIENACWVMLFFTCDGRRKAEESGNHYVLYFSAAAASFLLSLCFSILFPSCVGVVV